MRPLSILLAATLGFLLVLRLGELALSRIHARGLAKRGGLRAPEDGFGLLVLVHAGLFVALPAEWVWAPWAGTSWATPVLLSLFLVAVAVRAWAAWTLGDFYTVRVWKLPQAPLVAGGPYRWMRHPIYRAVTVEIVAVCLAFSAYATAAVLGGLNLAALARRIRLEERFLGLRD